MERLLPHRQLRNEQLISALDFYVYCRTGSLENVYSKAEYKKKVYCRTGSLEKRRETTKEAVHVYCRTGSLEMIRTMISFSKSVYCRTGSLEKWRGINRHLYFKLLNEDIFNFYELV